MRGNTLLARTISALAIISICVGPAMAGPKSKSDGSGGTATPIQHVVVIFQENVSFDHYFGSYPNATGFVAQPGTPTVNGLTGSLLTNNPNKNNPGNAPNQINPFLLDRSQASTCDQDHAYGDEQKAFDMGLMDMFPASVGQGGISDEGFCNPMYAYGMDKGIVEAYFDGNTVTAMWNYAQNYALNQNFYGTTFGPSTPGVLNLVAGNTSPATPSASSTKIVPNNSGPGTLVGDLDPTGDACSTKTSATVQMSGQNIGTLLTTAGLSWGSFMGGFDLTITGANGLAGCQKASPATPANDLNFPRSPSDPGFFTADYIPHHAFFQYWASTANPTHARPTVPPSEYGMFNSTGPGTTDAANHNYDINDFFASLSANNLPAVSFIKAPANMDGHAGYSDPLMEQEFVVNVTNAIQESDFWDSTAVVITWDDSDGWYDHQIGPIVNPSAVLQAASASNSDQLNGPGKCGNGTPMDSIEGRCGYGPRIPMLLISPWAKSNFVDSTLTDQSSIIHFIEDNFLGGERIGGGSFDAISGVIDNMFDFTQKVNPGHRHQVLLEPSTGEVTGGHK